MCYYSRKLESRDIHMKLIIAGVGPGNPQLITLEALEHARTSDVILVPRAHDASQGYAEKIIAHFFPAKTYLHITFPMHYDEHERIKTILAQLEGLNLEGKTVFFPVIGDVMLYATAKYLLDALNIDAEFVPGISAHSLAAATAKRFLAMREEIFTVIAGTAGETRIQQALSVCDCAAVYKPSVIGDWRELAAGFEAVRVDYAGWPELERVITGEEALMNIHDYLSILLLWRKN